LSPEHRRLAWLLLGGLALLLFYLVIVNPLLNLSDSWTQELTRQRQILVKYQGLIANKARVAQANQTMKAALANAGNQFLSGGNAAVAASDLQEIIKKLAREHGVQLTSTKIMPSREAGPYLEVPVQVQFNGSIDQVLIILYHLEHHKKLLFIPEMDINAPRWQKGEKNEVLLQINMVISGVINKGVAS